MTEHIYYMTAHIYYMTAHIYYMTAHIYYMTEHIYYNYDCAYILHLIILQHMNNHIRQDLTKNFLKKYLLFHCLVTLFSSLKPYNLNTVFNLYIHNENRGYKKYQQVSI